MAYQEPINKYHLIDEIGIDIAYHKIHPCVVAEYEAREAAVFGNYTWKEFNELELGEKAMCIAHYRMHHKIDAVVQQEVTEYSKRRSR